ncbi:hypothetical protein Tco_1209976 [Tanacetum coccineum]
MNANQTLMSVPVTLNLSRASRNFHLMNKHDSVSQQFKGLYSSTRNDFYANSSELEFTTTAMKLSRSKLFQKLFHHQTRQLHHDKKKKIVEFLFHPHITMLRRPYALSWKPCQGDSLNLPDHRIHKDGDGDASFQLESESLPHAHAQTTKTYYISSLSREIFSVDVVIVDLLCMAQAKVLDTDSATSASHSCLPTIWAIYHHKCHEFPVDVVIVDVLCTVHAKVLDIDNVASTCKCFGFNVDGLHYSMFVECVTVVGIPYGLLLPG